MVTAGLVAVVILAFIGSMVVVWGYDEQEGFAVFTGIVIISLAVWILSAMIPNPDKTSTSTTEAVTCPVCRVEVNTAFCGQCGWQAKQQTIYCPTCDIPIESKYCTSCGVAREEAQQRNVENFERKMQKTLDNQE